jgi:glycosyltransferase involved in cell wall biosynthesis
VYRRDDFYAARLQEVEIPVTLIPRRWKFDPLLPRNIGLWLDGAGVDLVHAFMTVPALWTLLAVRSLPRRRRPAFVASERDESIATTRWQAWMQGFVCRGSDAVTANAEIAGRAIVARLGIPSARVHCVPNGIDLDSWDRAAEQPCPFSLEPGCFHLALVGRLELQKNHALLIEALRRIDPARRARWRVWFVGAETGGRAFAASLQGQVVATGLEEQVQFVGRTPAVAALMRAIDCLVLPSRHEGFPNVVLEAMASRRLVVASRVGAVPQLLEDGRTGFVFASEDADDLAAALLRVSELSAAEREALGKRAREVVERRYTIAASADAYERLYESVLRARVDAEGSAA